jgi:hypothetical protein
MKEVGVVVTTTEKAFERIGKGKMTLRVIASFAHSALVNV